MHIKNSDRYSLAEAYTAVRECECQHADSMSHLQNSSEERVDMILNNLVVLNNKAAELVSTIQVAIDSGEGIDEWVSEKIAVATSMIGSITDYYAKFKQNNVSVLSVGSLANLSKGISAANSIPAPNTPMVGSISI